MVNLNFGGRKVIPREQAARGVCLLLCLCLFWVYLHNLDEWPLWLDEGASVYLSRLSPSVILQPVPITEDHPPGYYLLLSGWVTIFGTSPFSIRLPSVFAALTLAPLLYVTGKRLDGRGWVGIAAAVMGALLPYAVQHAREARMYTIMLAVVAASTYAFLRLLTAPTGHRGWWMAYVGLAIAGLHVHYAYALLCAAQGVAVLVGWALKRIRLKPWLIAAGVVAAAYLPWLSHIWPRMQVLLTGHLAGTHGPRLAWEAILPALQQGLMTGLPPIWSTLVLSALALAGLTGAAVLFRSQPVAAIYLGLGVVEGVLLITLLQRQLTNAALLAVRQTYFSVPLLVWLAAVGLRAWAKTSRWVGLAAAGFIIVSLGWNVPAFYRAPTDPAEDYRPLISQAATLYRPSDAVWTNYEWQQGYFESYAPQLPWAFYSGGSSSSPITDTLESLFAAHPRLWVVNYKVDVHDLVNYPFNAWLHAHTLLAFESWYGNSNLALFARAPALPSLWPAQATFEKGITLSYVPVAPRWKPGDLLVLSFRWQAAAPPSQPYSAFVHIRRADGPPVAQSDYALEALEPVGAWARGQPVTVSRAVLLPSDIAPGAYGVYVGLYNSQSPNERLNVASPSGCDLPDGVCIGTIEVVGSENQP